MKEENPHNRELVRLLREALPRGVTYKHNDMSTKGIPDISVTYRARTIWIEGKFEDDTARIDGGCLTISPTNIDGLQWETLRKMGNGYLCIYTNCGVALTHVNGFRRSVGLLRLRLRSTNAVVKQIVNIVKKGEEEE